MTSLVRGEEHQRTLVSELNHRVRNMLTVVVALAGQTLENAPDPALGLKTFIARLRAMARAYNLLSRLAWRDVPLHDVVQVEMQPFVVADRESCGGKRAGRSADAEGGAGLRACRARTGNERGEIRGALEGERRRRVVWAVNGEPAAAAWS